MKKTRRVHLVTPLAEEDTRSLRIGDLVYLSGVVYTARDLAHRRVTEYIDRGISLPIELRNTTIFHAGPIVEVEAAKRRLIVVGPTTSMRMEPYEARLIELGVKAVVGKGGMGEKTSRALEEYGGVYLVAAPGCGIIHASSVKRIVDVHWPELGVMEAIWVLEMNDWGPLTVAMDSKGGNLFEEVLKESKRRLPSIYESLRLQPQK